MSRRRRRRDRVDQWWKGHAVRYNTPMGSARDRSRDRTGAAGTLKHPALLHAGTDDFLAYIGPFVAEGVERGEPTLVAVDAGNLSALRDVIGGDAPTVTWADTTTWFPHTGTRLRAFHDLLTEQREAGATHVRLVGEPVWPGEPARVREWQRYESVLNHVLAAFPVTLVCTYDTSRLDPLIIDGARRTHPAFHQGSERASNAFVDPAEFLRGWAHELMPPPVSAVRVSNLADLGATRRAVLELAREAGLGDEAANDMCLAASEVVTNALLHGGGAATLFAWSEGESFVCQIEDEGAGIADPFAGYRPPDPTAMNGRGLWLARQMVDLLQIGPGASGAAVRLDIAGVPRSAA
jgi:anti-sigma regulatory factor (Ser/Thr protein kinase)